MQFTQIILAIFTVVLLASGQILFKLASEDIVLKSTQIFTSFLSFKLFLALFVYFVATIMWLIVLKETPLRLAYPFVALAFFIVPIVSHFFLGESIGWNTFTGALIIALGVYVSVYK